MQIAVFGAGGVGGYFGGRLAQAGEEVIFIARGQHLQAMLTTGLRVESLQGDFMLERIKATHDPGQVGQVEAILLAVKAWQVKEAALAMRPMVGPETIVVPLQNGVEAPGELAEVLGAEHVLGGLCHIVSTIAAPGFIRHTGLEPYIAFGELDRRSSQRSDRLKQVFSRAGVKAEVVDDIQAAMWEKLLFIASIGSVGTATRAPVGVIRSLPETLYLLQQGMEEIAAVAEAQGIRLPRGVVQKTLTFVNTLPHGTTTSMQRDILESRPSELAYQVGAVVRLGKKQGVFTPTNTCLYTSLLPQELRARGVLSF